MDYEKLHKDTINKLQQMVNSGKITVEVARGICADFIPESEDEKIRKELISYLDNFTNSEDRELVDKFIAWLEKQGKKPTYKVEPKFKVGDWVVTSYGKVNQVVSVDKDGDGYNLDDGVYFSGSWCDMYHLWTIQDAKDGDVLSYRDGQWCFIYKGIVTEDIFKYYALLSEKGIIVNDAAFSLLSSCITPATKEQRDTLMKAMADAGYTFDFDKKELKKIELSEWSEEDKCMLNNVIDTLKPLRQTTHSGYSINSMITWLKSIKDRVQH